MLLEEVAEDISTVPRESISAYEYLLLARAEEDRFNFNRAREYYQTAIMNSKELGQELAALRAFANLQFLEGQKEAARVSYKQAMNIFTKYSDTDSFTRALSNAQTELDWASSEAAAKELQSASQHVREANSIVDTLPDCPQKHVLQVQITLSRQMIDQLAKQ